QVPDLVEEERPLVRQLKAPECACQGAREGAALMAEELALQEPCWHGGAVHRDEGAVAARTALVNGAGEELFAGAGLPLEEDGRVCGGDERDLLQHRGQRSAGADDLWKTTFRVAPAFTIALCLTHVFGCVDDRGILECHAVHGHHSRYGVPTRGRRKPTWRDALRVEMVDLQPVNPHGG